MISSIIRRCFNNTLTVIPYGTAANWTGTRTTRPYDGPRIYYSTKYSEYRSHNHDRLIIYNNLQPVIIDLRCQCQEVFNNVSVRRLVNDESRVSLTSNVVGREPIFRKREMLFMNLVLIVFAAAFPG